MNNLYSNSDINNRYIINQDSIKENISPNSSEKKNYSNDKFINKLNIKDESKKAEEQQNTTYIYLYLNIIERIIY